MDMGRVIREVEAPAPLDIPIEAEPLGEPEQPRRPSPVASVEPVPVGAGTGQGL